MRTLASLRWQGSFADRNLHLLYQRLDQQMSLLHTVIVGALAKRLQRIEEVLQRTRVRLSRA